MPEQPATRHLGAAGLRHQYGKGTATLHLVNNLADDMDDLFRLKTKRSTKGVPFLVGTELAFHLYPLSPDPLRPVVGFVRVTPLIWISVDERSSGQCKHKLRTTRDAVFSAGFGGVDVSFAPWVFLFNVMLDRTSLFGGSGQRPARPATLLLDCRDTCGDEETHAWCGDGNESGMEEVRRCQVGSWKSSDGSSFLLSGLDVTE
ncbi:hypothetical protein B0T21DRAFT_394506 [Apiosordaria backusii]|uniref:Uncharacterized protein n=1 Tax=Apiosordaria backusii TaxID=314023 RepID=A0AA40E6V9_9PEZI|nr:hypothetical protein B0T21DRAFT_394506 [Apiosordaria backusii]